MEETEKELVDLRLCVNGNFEPYDKEKHEITVMPNPKGELIVGYYRKEIKTQE